MNKNEGKGFEGNPELSQDAKDALDQDVKATIKANTHWVNRLPQPVKGIIALVGAGIGIFIIGLIAKTVVELFMLGFNIY